MGQEPPVRPCHQNGKGVAPLLGKTRIITLPDGNAPLRRRDRRDTSLWRQYLADVDTMNYTEWAEHAEATLNFAGVPVGVPDRYRAMGKVGSGLMAVLLPGVQVAHNTAWINYIWYNQQCFINYTLGALGLIKSQLHATSIMAAQNRFALDQMRAPEEGVCTMIGPECCAAIPLHTGARGALTKVLARLKALQREHVANSGTRDLFSLPGWMGWFFSGSWLASLSQLGLALGVLFVFVLLIFCCIIPCTRKLALSAVTTTNISGQYVVMGEALLPQRGVVFKYSTNHYADDLTNETDSVYTDMLELTRRTTAGSRGDNDNMDNRKDQGNTDIENLLVPAEGHTLEPLLSEKEQAL